MSTRTIQTRSYKKKQEAIEELKKEKQKRLKKAKLKLVKPIPKKTFTCCFCWFDYLLEIPHYKCKNSTRRICSVCLPQWLIPSPRNNRAGWNRSLKCICGRHDLDIQQLQNILSKELFDLFESQETKIAIRKMPNMIHCPTPDCEAIYMKMKRRKRCRKAACESCDESLCGYCGEAYTKEHAKMKCGEYKKWKEQNDEFGQLTTSLKRLKQMQKCPGCKNLIEKNHGCSSMNCTFCQATYCWRCNKERIKGKCGCCRRCGQKLQKGKCFKCCENCGSEIVKGKCVNCMR